MAMHEFLQKLMQRTGAEAVNVRALAGAVTCDIHLFYKETVLSFECEPADWDNPQTIIDAIGKHVDSVQMEAS